MSPRGGSGARGGQPWSPGSFSGFSPSSFSISYQSSGSSAASYPAEMEKPSSLAPEKALPLKAPDVAERPGYGTVGKKTRLRLTISFFKLPTKISTKLTSKNLCRDIIKQLGEMYRQSYLVERFLVIRRTNVYVAAELPFSSKEFIINFGGRREQEFKVTIKFASKPNVNHLKQFLSGRQRYAPHETIQALDVILRALPSVSGYYQSIRPVQMGLSLNIDVSARSFYEAICVTDYVKKHLNLNNLSRLLSDQNCIKIERVLKGVKVKLTHRKYARTYKIAGLSLEPLSKLTFTLDDKKTQTSVVQFYQEKYGGVLKYTSLPAVQAGNDAKPTFLPMELCQIVKGQRYTKNLNEQQVTALLRATCQHPRERKESIVKTVKLNNYNYKEDPFVKDFGVQVREQLCDVDARVLPSPKLKYHESGRESTVEPMMGQWNMINKKMIDGGRVDHWTCVNFSSSVDPALQNEFCHQLVETCNSRGMVFNRNPVIPYCTARSNQIESALKEIHRQSVGSLGQSLQFLLIIILPDETGFFYEKIKRVCETELGIVSQCCEPKKAPKLDRHYFSNVALKINAKVGGRNHVLSDAIEWRIPLVTDRPTIIFGAHVTHPQSGEDSTPSIAAVVASMDWLQVTKYRGVVSAQAHREEIIQDLYKSVPDSQGGVFRDD